MAFQRFCTVVLGLFVLLHVSFEPAAAQAQQQDINFNSLSDKDFKALTIQLERIRCYGSCPAYTVTIHGDGRVEYVGGKYVKVTGPREGRIEPAAIKELLAEFEKTKFLSLSEDLSEAKCTCRRCTDMASAVVEIKVGAVTRRVNHYYGCACAPKALFELESAIDKAVDSEQWTGDVSKQGPFGTTCFG